MKPSYILIVLLLVLPSCSTKNEKELFSEGQAAEEQSDFQIAIERYQEILDRFPGNAHADSALYRIAVIYNNDLHDFVKAVHSYQKYYATFPNSSVAPTALFLCGFIFNNELHELDSARASYQRFIERFPDHQLAASASFELETLGKDPGEFIRPEVAATADEPAKKSTKAPKR